MGWGGWNNCDHSCATAKRACAAVLGLTHTPLAACNHNEANPGAEVRGPLNNRDHTLRSPTRSAEARDAKCERPPRRRAAPRARWASAIHDLAASNCSPAGITRRSCSWSSRGSLTKLPSELGSSSAVHDCTASTPKPNLRPHAAQSAWNKSPSTSTAQSTRDREPALCATRRAKPSLARSHAVAAARCARAPPSAGTPMWVKTEVAVARRAKVQYTFPTHRDCGAPHSCQPLEGWARPWRVTPQ